MTSTTATRTPVPPQAPAHPRVAGFLALTFALTWLPWLGALALGGDIADPGVFALYVLGGFGPTLAALVQRLRGVRSLRFASVVRAPRWLPAALLLGAAPAVLAAVIGPLLGAPALGVDDITAAFAGSGLLQFLLIATVAGPLAEEFGWRGYLQPRLRERFSPVVTAVVLGGIWAIWHLPLFLLTGTWQSTLSLVEGLGFLLVMVPMSLTYWFVSERLRGGVPGAVVMHYAGNVSLSLLPFTALTGGLVYVATAVAIAAVVLPTAARRGGRPLLART